MEEIVEATVRLCGRRRNLTIRSVSGRNASWNIEVVYPQGFDPIPMSRDAQSSPLERGRNELARRVLAGVLALRGQRPIPSGLVETLTRISASRNTLSDWFLSRPEPVLELSNASARTALRYAADSPWAMAPDSLNFLWAIVRRIRPNAVLEFGGGHSTVVIAAAMAEVHGKDGPAHVWSIDESAEWLETTRGLLARAGVDGRVKLAHTPLREQTFAGGTSLSYALDESFLADFLDSRPDLVLIDGPSGGGLARLPTLPLVADRLARPCTFFLDDAFRTDETQIAAIWRSEYGVILRGVHPRGHGVLEGVLA